MSDNDDNVAMAAVSRHTPPLVSVVMPVYNGERFLNEAINSIRAQAFTNFEFIIIDDGSTDATHGILLRHAQADSRIRVFSQTNMGLIESLTRGYSAATGAYIARMDADDVARPGRLGKQLSFMTNNPSVGLVGGWVELIDSTGRVYDEIRLPVEPQKVRHHMREYGCCIAHPTALFRRNLLQELRGLRKAYRHAEDYDLWLRMLEITDIANINDVVLSYRRHSTSVSFQNAKQQVLSAICAKRTAQLRLAGLSDPTCSVDIITESVLRRTGLTQKEIDDDIFAGLLSIAEDAVRFGQYSAAVEFCRTARPYAQGGRLKTAGTELNFKALRAQGRMLAKLQHLGKLLLVNPTIFGTVMRTGFRSLMTSALMTSPKSACASYIRRQHDGKIPMTGQTLVEIMKRQRYPTDKSDEYLQDYEKVFSQLRDKPVAVLEIGVHKGGSLLLWRDYFSRGDIYGVDLYPPLDFQDPSGRIKVFACDQGNPEEMDMIAKQASPTGFDIIIDDASHIGELTAETFQVLFYQHLKSGGIYAIEDWGTGYWETHPDGAKPDYHDNPSFESHGNRFQSHDYGMVGFVKQLVDECALADVLHPIFGVAGSRRGLIRSLHLSVGLAIIEKSEE